MAIDFPSAPTTGQLWPSPAVVGQPQYIWDGQKWTTQGVPPRQPVYADGSVPMAAQLTLVGDPTHPTDAADKHYVDTYIASASMLAKNYIINSAMQISQENGSTAGTIPGYYAADQWYINSTFTGFNIAQVASPTPGGSPNRIRCTVTTAGAVVTGTIAYLRQAIEGLRAADLGSGTANAKQITIRFGVKAPAGIYNVALYNATVNRFYVAEYTIAAGEANTDVVKTVTLQLDTAGTWASDNTVGLYVNFGLACGTTYQGGPNAWVSGTGIFGTANQFNLFSTAGNVFELFDVGLYQGNAAPPFRVPDYVSELALCQRYFNVYRSLIISSYSQAGGSIFADYSLSPPMRVAPTNTYSNGVFNNTTGGVATNVTLVNHFRTVTTILATGYGYAIYDVVLSARM